MNITPITKEYTNPINVKAISFGNDKAVNKKQESVFSCPKTIVKNTLVEFSNSRGNCLADIDLTDCYIKNAVPAKIAFLADMELCDAYELPKDNKVKQSTKNISFTGPFPQYLIDQDAVAEEYATASDGIKDIANSSYCSFNGKHNFGDKVIDAISDFLSKVLPL